MDFIITKEQKRIQKAAREFFNKECPSEFVREMEQSEKGFTDEFWRKMGDLDWMALIIPEAYDGVGGGLFDLVLMLEEMGRACAPGPYFPTVVTGALPIVKYGNEEQKKQFLPGIANAELILTFAILEPDNRKWDPYGVSMKAVSEGDEFVLNGTKLFVPNADSADYIICAARTAGRPSDPYGLTLFIVDASEAGIQSTPLKTISGDKQFEVSFEGVRVPKSSVLGEENEGGEALEKILQYAAVCKCAEMVGGADKVLEMSAQYAKDRMQFGRVIGSFQAVQHHCANMLIDLEGSRYITYKAAFSLENEFSSPDWQVAAAKAWVSEAYLRIVKLGHQVQGGYAFMDEHDMPFYSRRAVAAAVAFGDPSFYRKVVEKELHLRS